MDSRLISFSPDLSDQPGSFPIEKPPDHQHPPEDSLDLLGTSVMAMTAQGEGEGTDDIGVSTGFGFSPHPDSMMSIQDSSLPNTLTPKLYAGGATGSGNNLYWKQAHYVPNAKDRCGRCNGCGTKTCMSKGSKLEEILETHNARCCVNCADKKIAYNAPGHMGVIAIYGPHIWLKTIKGQSLRTMNRRDQIMGKRMCLLWVQMGFISLRMVWRQLPSNKLHHPGITPSPALPHMGGSWGGLLRRRRRRLMQGLRQTR